jgi:RNA polymerase sigma factor (sigma-70 family)
VAIGRNGAAARQLNTLFNVGPTGSLTDGQLLERFATRPGEGAELAFAALVERHGPLVLRVCRSVLRDEHAAHDAFQATFLVLVDKARSLWVQDSLSPWLHAVAYRVALCARGASARRRRHEHARAAINPGTTLEELPETRELGQVLHEEIEALPERYRVPIVLCDLEGRSHDEAARHLGWPVGTVKSRQARGRDRLRARLVRRGVAPAIGIGIGATTAEGATVSPALASATAAVAGRITANGLGAAPAPVASLAKEALMGILIGKLKWAGIVLLGLALVATGAFAFVSGGMKGRRPAPRVLKTVIVQDDAARDRVGKIYFGEDNGLFAVDPKTGAASRLLIQCKDRPRISPDGRLIAFEWEGAVWVRELDRLVEPRKLLDLGDAEFGHPVWSADSSKLIVSKGKKPVKGGPWRFKTVRINADGTGLEELAIPGEDGVQDWSPGDWLVTTSSRNAEIGWELYVMKPDGKEQRQITKGGNPYYTRFSPDGKRVLYTDGTTEVLRGIWVVGLDGKDRRKVLSILGAVEWSACWSPDGKRIAVIIIDKPQAGQPQKARLVIQEVDGESRTEFPLDDVKMADMPDWR